MLDSILESLRVISLPTKTNFRSVTAREVALFCGKEGWAEFSPFLEYQPTECVPWLVSAIESSMLPVPQQYRNRVEINATLPAVNGSEKIAEILSWFPNCTSVKIKIGGNHQEDLARITQARLTRPTAKIRLDVNGGWSVDQALVQLTSIVEAVGDIEYVEQPCSTLEELRDLKRKLPIPIPFVGDEALRKSTDPMKVDLRGAVDIVMLKVAPLGGIRRATEIADLHGLPTVVSSALESAVGISYGLKFAATFEDQRYAAGLGTGQLLAADIGNFPIVDGAIQVDSIVPSQFELDRYSVSHDRVEWWRERIRQTWSAGAQSWVLREGWY